MKSASIDVSNPGKPERVAIIASNPSVSKQPGLPIRFWWTELTHAYWEFTEHGYRVNIYSPDGGKLQGDGLSDPQDKGKLMAEISFLWGSSSRSSIFALVENSKPITQLKVSDYDANRDSSLNCSSVIPTCLLTAE